MADIEVTFATNAAVVSSQIDQAAASTVKAESAAIKFNAVQKVGELRAGALVTQLRGMGHIMSGFGLNVGHATGFVSGLVHVLSEMNPIGIAIGATIGAAAFAYHEYAKGAEAAAKASEAFSAALKNQHEVSVAVGDSATSIAEKMQKYYHQAEARGYSPADVSQAMKAHPTLSNETVAKLKATGATESEMHEAELLNRIGVDPEKGLARERQARTTGMFDQDKLFQVAQGGQMPGERKRLSAQERFEQSQELQLPRSSAERMFNAPASDIDYSVTAKNFNESLDAVALATNKLTDAISQSIISNKTLTDKLDNTAQAVTSAKRDKDSANGVTIKTVR